MRKLEVLRRNVQFVDLDGANAQQAVVEVGMILCLSHVAVDQGKCSETKPDGGIERLLSCTDLAAHVSPLQRVRSHYLHLPEVVSSHDEQLAREQKELPGCREPTKLLMRVWKQEPSAEIPFSDPQVCDHVDSGLTHGRQCSLLVHGAECVWPYFPTAAPLDSCYHHAQAEVLLR